MLRCAGCRICAGTRTADLDCTGLGSTASCACHVARRCYCVQALAVLAVTLMGVPALGARQLLQQAVTDADIYNFALNLEYLEASILRCLPSVSRLRHFHALQVVSCGY